MGILERIGLRKEKTVSEKPDVVDGTDTKEEKFITIAGTVYQHTANEKLGLKGGAPRMKEWVIKIPITDEELDFVDDQVEVMLQVYQYIIDELKYFRLNLDGFVKEEIKDE